MLRKPEPEIRVLAVPALLVAFFFGGLAEELGWMGYAIDPMQARWGALRASLLLGAFWAAWHWVPLLQGDEVLSWIAWWSAGDLALRILHVWIYDNTGGSVFGQALFHASFNVAWQLFPNDGSHFDPAFTTPILVAAALLVVGWSRRGRHGMPPVQRKFGFTKSCEGRTVAAESPETLVDHRKVIARGSGDSPASEDPPVQPSKASGGGHEHTRWRSP